MQNQPKHLRLKILTHSIYYFVLSIIVYGTAIAQDQDTFAEKKGRKPDTDLEKRIKPFTFPNHLKPSSKSPSPKKQINFQIKGPLQKKTNSNIYTHQSIKRNDAGTPIFISSKINMEANARMAPMDIPTTSKNYLKEIGHILQIEDPENEFKIKNIYEDRLGKKHVKLQQQYKGVNVFGKEVILHLNNNNVALFNGRSISTPIQINTKPSLNSAMAKENAMHDISSVTKISKPNKSLLEIIGHNDQTSSPELVIYQHPRSKEVRLVWHMTVYPNMIERWEYFIDAHDGSVFNRYNHTCSIDGPGVGNAEDLNGVNQEINTYVVDDIHYLIDATKDMFDEANSTFPDNGKGVIMTLDLRDEPPSEDASVFHVNSDDNTWDDPSAISAHINASISYDYFLNTFGRNSINGVGGNIFSIVNVADEDGSGLDNAFWNGTAMFYGNGNVGFKPLAGALDVGGHEMSHGVIGTTANLEYQDQSGAINESFADIFGVLIDRDDYLLGEDVVTDFFPSGAMRSMEDPHNGGSGLGDRGFQPKHMSEIYTGPEDNGGVHINSGIPNHAFYLFATEVGKDIAEQVYYRALTVYLTASSQFIDLRLAVIQSAADLHGENSDEVQAAKEAFDAVGILDDEPTDTDPELPVLEGDDLVLFYNLDLTDPTTLYIYDVAEEAFQDISTTEVFRKPTVTDDGSLTLFIAEDNTMQAIDLSPPYDETEISPDPIWFNVSVAKDGTKFAAITNEADGKIYVYDLVSETSEIFELYNPTTAEGIQTGEVLYADALEWDYTGQYLMYDALNVIQSNTGEDIEYWDVGFLKVWNNEKEEFGDGSIQKLFTSLPDGVSIGNPSFARNSPNIVVFDMIDANENENYILAANIETNDVKAVFKNQKIGYPNYSRLDDIIVFDAIDDDDNPVIAAVEMEEDKITAAGSPFVFLNDAKWAQWFTQGTREVLSNEKEILTFNFVNLEALSEVSISGNNIEVTVPQEIDISSLVAVFTNSEKATVKIDEIKQISGITRNDFTNPVTYSVIAEDGSSQNYTVTVSHQKITGLEKLTSEISLYPNPTTGNVNIRIDKKEHSDMEIEILDTYGRLLHHHLISDLSIGKNNSYLLPFGHLPTGTYLVRFMTSEGIVVNKIIKG